jgi:phosphate:Na+ symporter
VIGTIVVYIIFKLGMPGVISLLHKVSGDNLGRCIANAHTMVKIFQVIILLPFSNWIVKLTYILIPGTDQSVNYRENYQLKYIGDKVVFNPATAVVDVLKEVERMANLANENLNRAMNALVTLDHEDIEEVYEVEKNINFLNKSITDYLVRINQTTLQIEDLKSLGALFHVVNDIERIGDHAENVADAAKRREEINVSFSSEAIKELGEMLNMVNTIVQFSIDTLHNVSDEHLEDIMNLEEAVDEKERELQQAHVDRLTRNECTPEAGMLYSDIVSGLERVADHATNIVLYLNQADEG